MLLTGQNHIAQDFSFEWSLRFDMHEWVFVYFMQIYKQRFIRLIHQFTIESGATNMIKIFVSSWLITYSYLL